MEPNDFKQHQDYTGQNIIVLDKPPSYNPTIDPAYVVLGFLSEYLGRRIVEHDDIIEHFYPGEVVVAAAFEKFLHILQQECGIVTAIERIIGDQGHIFFASRKITTLVQYLRQNLSRRKKQVIRPDFGLSADSHIRFNQSY